MRDVEVVEDNKARREVLGTQSPKSSVFSVLCVGFRLRNEFLGKHSNVECRVRTAVPSFSILKQE